MQFELSNYVNYNLNGIKDQMSTSLYVFQIMGVPDSIALLAIADVFFRLIGKCTVKYTEQKCNATPELFATYIQNYANQECN